MVNLKVGGSYRLRNLMVTKISEYDTISNWPYRGAIDLAVGGDTFDSRGSWRSDGTYGVTEGKDDFDIIEEIRLELENSITPYQSFCAAVSNNEKAIDLAYERNR